MTDLAPGIARDARRGASAAGTPPAAIARGSVADTAARNEVRAIVTFHGVGVPARPLDGGESDVWLRRDEFTRMLDVVTERPGVRVTIDDGNASDIDIVLPELLRRGLVGWFFIPAGRLGARGFLDAARVRDLVAAGMVVGSHGMHHRAWAGLPDTDLREEILASRRLLEDAAARLVDEAACPFGAYDRRSLALLGAAGFAHVYTSDRGPARPDRWLLPRNTIRTTDTADDVVRAITRRPGELGSLVCAARRFVKRWR